MGYPRTFPCAAAYYAPKTHGGIGLCHLGAKQGTQKILQILKHLRAKTTIGTVYQVLIDQYQLNSGFSEPILKTTTAITWSQAYWIDTLRAYWPDQRENHTQTTLDTPSLQRKQSVLDVVTNPSQPATIHSWIQSTQQCMHPSTSYHLIGHMQPHRNAHPIRVPPWCSNATKSSPALSLQLKHTNMAMTCDTKPSQLAIMVPNNA